MISFLDGFHEKGCPSIYDDESDYEYLHDAGQCTCNRKVIPNYPKISRENKEIRKMIADALRIWRRQEK